MKNKSLKLIIICACLFLVYFILTNNKLINENILFGIDLWIKKVFPALFPMFIINEILISLDFPVIITKILNKFFKNHLKINPYAIYVFIMSIFSGTPSNAFIVKNLVNNNELSSKDASYILAFTFFSNPLFLFTMLSNSFNKVIIIKIILIHYLTNIFIYLLFHKKISVSNTEFKRNKTNNIKISNVLTNSIKKSLDTLIMILGTITFYIIISTILINCFDFNPIIETFIKGGLEITQGLNMLSQLTVSTKLKEIIAISIISFGGLSIHSQIQNIISETEINYKYFFKGRLLHTAISAIMILLF